MSSQAPSSCSPSDSVISNRLPDASVITKPDQPLNSHLAVLENKKSRLIAKLDDLSAQRSALITDADGAVSSESSIRQVSGEERVLQVTKAASRIVRDHIKLLQRYNEIKDVGQGLMGLVADQRGVRIGSVMEEHGLSTKD